MKSVWLWKNWNDFFCSDLVTEISSNCSSFLHLFTFSWSFLFYFSFPRSGSYNCRNIKSCWRGIHGKTISSIRWDACYLSSLHHHLSPYLFDFFIVFYIIFIIIFHIIFHIIFLKIIFHFYFISISFYFTSI